MHPRAAYLASPSKAVLAAALVGVLAAIGPARTESGDQNDQGMTEVRRFCTNIADAARDRRYALQAQELERLKAEVDARMQALEEKRREYEEWLQRREEFLAKAQDSLVSIYARMKPDAAAERLAEVKIELAAGIIMKLDPRQASTILNEMDSKAAAMITGVMASAARKVDPS